MTRPKFTAPVRRGFTFILAALAEDCDHDLESPQHPMHRRQKGQALKDGIAAIKYLRAFAEVQHDKPDKPGTPPAEPINTGVSP